MSHRGFSVAVVLAVVMPVVMAVVMAVVVAVVVAVFVAVVSPWLWFSRDVAMRCHIVLCPEVYVIYMAIIKRPAYKSRRHPSSIQNLSRVHHWRALPHEGQLRRYRWHVTVMARSWQAFANPFY